MSEILPNVHRIELELGGRMLAQHILAGDRVYLVDTGVASTPENHIFPYLERIGISPDDVTGAIITHPDSDHFGGNAVLRVRCPRALIMAHALDAPLIESPERCLGERYDFERPYGVPMPPATRVRVRQGMGEATSVDLHLCGEERLRIAPERWVQVRHCAGHSRGHLILYDPVHRAAIVADAVLGAYIPIASGEPMFAPTYRFKRDYLDTIRHLRSLELETMLCSHFPVIQGHRSVDEFLDMSEEFVYRLDRLIAEALLQASAPLTLSAIVDRVGDRLAAWASPEDPFVSYSLCYPVAAALDEEVASGRVALSSSKHINHYTLQ